MANNRVEVVQDFLYNGDDQMIWYVPSGVDESGIAIEDWEIVVRFHEGRMAQMTSSDVGDIPDLSLTWDLGTERFYGLLERAVTVGMAPGPWTMDLYRTNANAAKLLLRVDLTVLATILNTTTSTTTTTTTTTP